MKQPNPVFLQAIALLAEQLPERAIQHVIDAIGGLHPWDWNVVQTTLERVFAAPQYRDHVTRFLQIWRTEAPDVSRESVVWAIQSAAYTTQQQRRSQRLELVWTGPTSVYPLRRTAQVLQEMIEAAQRELLIVSFAVYDIPEIGASLHRALERGVHLQLVIESAKDSEGKIAYDSLAAFGTRVADNASIYYWPKALRPVDQSGRHGSLHAKCAVADAHTMLISSANLTHYALNLNMELGVFIRGGNLPQHVAKHFAYLASQQVIVPAQTP